MREVTNEEMKRWEEVTTASKLLPATPVVARLDGRAFHTKTAKLNRPYDVDFIMCMKAVTLALMKEFNCDMGQTHSDEISLYWINGMKNGTEPERQFLFDGTIFKLCSVLASQTTAFFIQHMSDTLLKKFNAYDAVFDCRVFNVKKFSVCKAINDNRIRDALKNSVNQMAHHYLRESDLFGKNTKTRIKMLYEKGHDINKELLGFRKGFVFKKETVERKFTLDELSKLPEKHNARKDPNLTVRRVRIVEV